MSSRARKTSAKPPSSHVHESLRPLRVRNGEGYAVARDGSPIYYRTFGSVASAEGAERRLPIVLSDGIGCDGYVWKYLERTLADERFLVHWHYRGHGRTPEPRDRRRVSMADLADDLACVMDAVGVERAVLAGHSMGVQVCLETYRRYRDRVSGLVLMCGAYGHPLRTFRGRRTLETALPWLAFGVNRAPHLIQAVWRNLVPTRLAFALATRLEVNGDLVRLEDFMPYLEHIARVDLPLFLEMHALIRSSELLVVEGGSHTAPIERPHFVNEAVARFLHAVEAGQSPQTTLGATSATVRGPMPGTAAKSSTR